MQLTMKKKLILLFLLINSSMLLFAQKRTFDTIEYIRGGKVFRQVFRNDTLFFNNDTILLGSGIVVGTTPTDTTGFFSAWHIVQEFTETVTHSHGQTHLLVGPAIPNSVLISLNGRELAKSEYSLTVAPGDGTSNTGVGVFYIKLPVYEFDRIKILYAYTKANSISID